MAAYRDIFEISILPTYVEILCVAVAYRQMVTITYVQIVHVEPTNVFIICLTEFAKSMIFQILANIYTTNNFCELRPHPNVDDKYLSKIGSRQM